MSHDEEKADEKELQELTQKLKNGLDIKDRKWMLNSYEKCFVGSEAVQYMVGNNICKTREEGVYLGKMLLAANIIRHVTNDHDFKDEKKFYKFSSDDPSHGQKAKKADTNEDWSWSDFIPGKFKNILMESNDDKKYNLQPHLEELNDEVKYASYNNDNDSNQIDLAPKETYGITPLDEYNKKLLDNVHPLKWVEPKPQPKYNMVAIGAGAAGLITAAGTAGLGGKVAIIEEHMFGGDCLNFGCVPSKALLRSARVAYDAIIRGKEFGIKVDGKISIDFEAVMARVRKIRSKISAHDACERFTKTYGMDVYLGHAEFISSDTIKVNDSILKFARCVIATGAQASVPPIPGLDKVKYLTNQTVWNLTALPGSLGVLGSGPIGCELAQAFSLLGSSVTVMNRSNRILGKEDISAAEIIKKSMSKCNVKFLTGLKFVSVSNDKNNKIIVEVLLNENKEKKLLSFDHLLIATGRKPNVENMGLNIAKVKYDNRNGIVVNDFLQTTNNNIYAAGDCCTRFQFTHMADAMARIVIRNSLFFGRSKVSDLIIPWTTYTFPEVAHVGLYEQDLKERKIDYDIIKIDLSHNDRAICDGEDEYNGFVKVLIKKNSDSILGATIVSDNAGDQINEFTLAIQSNVGLAFLGSVIHSYPTVAEGIKHSGDAFNRTRLTPITKTLLRKILSARR